MNFETWLQSDLTKPLKVQALHGVFFSADNAANLIGAEVYDGGAPASLSGTCIGYAIRADGGTLTITGTVSGNKASIILPTSAYVIEGPLDIVIKVISGSVKTTVGACRGYVQRATTDTIIDPGHVIPSLEELLAQIDACEQATDAANTAASNANSKATAANTAATNANTATGNANTATTRANAASAALENMDATASGLAAGATPTATVSTVNNHYRIAFGIPKGDKGDTGDTGAAATITNTATAYQNSTSGTTIPTGTWQTTQPDTPQGQFLWIRTILTWNNGQTSTLYSVSRMGIDGSGSVVSVNNVSPDANGNVTLPVDAVPTNGSTNPVSSDGVYTGLDGKQDKLTLPLAIAQGGTGAVTQEQAIYDLMAYAPYITKYISTEDLNNLTHSGFYQVSGVAANEPNAVPHFVISLTNADGTRRTQFAWRSTGNTTTNSAYTIYMRKYVDDTWGAWRVVRTPGTALTIAEGGTGATTAAAALTNLGIDRLFATGGLYQTMSDLITAIQSYTNNDKLVCGVAVNVLNALTGGSSTLGGIVVILKSNASNAYYFAFNRDEAGYGNINFSSASATVLHPLVDNAYKAGDTFSASTINMAGTLTNSTKSIMLTVVVPKSLQNISSVTVTSLKGGIRSYFGGYLGSGNAASPWATATSFDLVGASGTTMTATKASDNTVLINIYSTTAYTQGTTTTAIANNVVLTFYGSVTMTFS